MTDEQKKLENIEKAKQMLKDKTGHSQPEVNAGKLPQKDEGALVCSGIVEPLASIERIKDAWAKWQAIKAAVIESKDVQPIIRDGKKEAYIKKSGWRKAQVAYGIRTEIMEHGREEIGGIVYHNFKVRATSPSGSYAETWGSCNTGERKFAHGESDVMMTAQTRATNRAISDLIGGGDVSAEEME